MVKVNAFPGHNIALGSIFLTTTIAPAVATVVCMIFTWLKYGKPDVSMCLNASLAGFAMLPESIEEGTPKFTKIEIICKESRFEALKTAMMSLGITGMTVSHVLGCGIQKGKPEYYRGVQVEANLLPKVQIDIVVSKVPVRSVIETAKKVLYTGHIGDGKIFVYDVENVVKVRTGEEGFEALQDVE